MENDINLIIWKGDFLRNLWSCSFPASILRKSTATLTGRWRPDIDLRRMLTGILLYDIMT